MRGIVINLCDLSQLTTRWRGGSKSLTEYIWVEINCSYSLKSKTKKQFWVWEIDELLAIKLNQAFWYMNLIEAVQCLSAQDIKLWIK